MATTKYQPLSRGVDSVGVLDRKVVLEKLTESIVRGSVKMDFADWKTKWANIRETTGNEVDVGGAESSTGLIEVMIRYDKDLFDIGKNAETYRLRFSTIATNQTHSQYYNILRVSEFEGRKRFMKLICNRVR